ncbi:branched-chain amino acid aminotransferase [Flavobacterium sp. 316]|uniref:DUF4920 domain-containing protein n=1 Tax=Flavobacterium sediminilitoris TaxID=2024526 RepID=A0ABY4HN55_9FLAO|nr:MULTISPECIES: DUF4920 domain-containing protein [Flavobacterium]KIX22610.1 branched-chain amino acid aminotransferase [Flavobacterium sp. 316]UOX32919.1 DUF4920 domain-containing protein [Flavobacterium sediminilitoris]
MKKIVCFIAFAFLIISCQDKKDINTAKEIVENQISYATFGDSIAADGAISKEEMLEKFKTLKEGDTIDVKFSSKIEEVCQKKGCWMKLNLADDNSTFVKFKDYAFFVPKNAQEKEAIVNGKAFVSVESVDDLKHYAKDAGKSQEAIDSITEPKVRYSFMADGVLIVK